MSPAILQINLVAFIRCERTFGNTGLNLLQLYHQTILACLTSVTTKEKTNVYEVI